MPVTRNKGRSDKQRKVHEPTTPICPLVMTSPKPQRKVRHRRQNPLSTPSPIRAAKSQPGPGANVFLGPQAKRHSSHSLCIHSLTPPPPPLPNHKTPSVAPAWTIVVVWFCLQLDLNEVHRLIGTCTDTLSIRTRRFVI